MAGESDPPLPDEPETPEIVLGPACSSQNTPERAKGERITCMVIVDHGTSSIGRTTHSTGSSRSAVSKPVSLKRTDDLLHGEIAELPEELRGDHGLWVMVTTGASTVSTPSCGSSSPASSISST